MPRVFGYTRVSTEDQADSGAGLDAHRHQIEAEYKRTFAAAGFEWAGTFEDAAVSGGKAFDTRPAGFALNKVVQKGDVVLFPKLDRGFRNTEDALRTVRLWEEKGVRAVFLDLHLDTGTAAGKMMLTVFAAWAEFERNRGRERTREALAARKRKGRILGRPPWGIRFVGVKEHKRMEIVPEEYRIGQWVVEQKMKGYTTADITSHLNRTNVEKPHRKGGARSTIVRNGWSQSSVERVYRSTLRVARWIADRKVAAPPAVPA